MYYSAGLLSKKDIYPDHKSSFLKGQKFASTPVREKKEKAEKPVRQSKKKIKEEEHETELKVTPLKTEPGLSETCIDEKDVSDVQPARILGVTIKKEPVDHTELADFSFDSDADEADGIGLFRNVIENRNRLESPSPIPSISPSPMSPSPHASPKGRKKKERIKKEKGDKKGKSKKEKEPSVKTLIAQRRKLWLLTCKKEISKVFIINNI